MTATLADVRKAWVDYAAARREREARPSYHAAAVEQRMKRDLMNLLKESVKWEQ